MAWAPDYATAAELRSWVTRSAVTTDDDQLALAVTDASRIVDQFCNRQFGKVDSATARVWTAEWDRRRRQWLIDVDDIWSVSDLTIMVDDDDDQVFDQEITDYRLWPIQPEPGRPWTRILVKTDSTVQPSCAEGAVRVTANYGWAAVPTPIKTATLIEGARIFMRRVASFGIAGSPETGSELRLLRDVDVDAQKALVPYRRVWGAV